MSLQSLMIAKKQLSGISLPIIGFKIKLNLLQVTSSHNAQGIMPRSHHHRHSLRYFQRLASWINWALNTYPLLHPGLSALYAKISGETRTHTLISLNLAVISKLAWNSQHLENLDGVSLLLLLTWGPDKASFTMYMDALLQGLGFWSPSHCARF